MLEGCQDRGTTEKCSQRLSVKKEICSGGLGQTGAVRGLNDEKGTRGASERSQQSEELV